MQSFLKQKAFQRTTPSRKRRRTVPRVGQSAARSRRPPELLKVPRAARRRKRLLSTASRTISAYTPKTRRRAKRPIAPAPSPRRFKRSRRAPRQRLPANAQPFPRAAPVSRAAPPSPPRHLQRARRRQQQRMSLRTPSQSRHVTPHGRRRAPAALRVFDRRRQTVPVTVSSYAAAVTLPSKQCKHQIVPATISKFH